MCTSARLPGSLQLCLSPPSAWHPQVVASVGTRLPMKGDLAGSRGPWRRASLGPAAHPCSSHTGLPSFGLSVSPSNSARVLASSAPPAAASPSPPIPPLPSAMKARRESTVSGCAGQGPPGVCWGRSWCKPRRRGAGSPQQPPSRWLDAMPQVGRGTLPVPRSRLPLFLPGEGPKTRLGWQTWWHREAPGTAPDRPRGQTSWISVVGRLDITFPQTPHAQQPGTRGCAKGVLQDRGPVSSRAPGCPHPVRAAWAQAGWHLRQATRAREGERARDGPAILRAAPS